jgi:hypothetical protein
VLRKLALKHFPAKFSSEIFSKQGLFPSFLTGIFLFIFHGIDFFAYALIACLLMRLEEER